MVKQKKPSFAIWVRKSQPQQAGPWLILLLRAGSAVVQDLGGCDARSYSSGARCGRDRGNKTHCHLSDKHHWCQHNLDLS